MKIAVIGKVDPGYPYLEWKEMMESNVDVSSIDLVNITVGNGTLNKHVRKYAAANNIPIMEHASDYKAYGDDAKRIRNLALIDNSDLVVGFLPKGSSKESWIFRPGISKGRKVIVIEC